MLRLLVLLITATILSCGTAKVVDARWDGTVRSPAVQKWFKSQHNAQGQWCCDEADGHRYDGDYHINEDGSVTLYVDDNAHVLPDYMVLKGPNLAGFPVWWYLETGGNHTDFCFAPGTLT